MEVKGKGAISIFGIRLSFPKIPSAGDLASDFPCSAGNNSLLAP